MSWPSVYRRHFGGAVTIERSGEECALAHCMVCGWSWHYCGGTGTDETVQKDHKAAVAANALDSIEDPE